MIRNGLASSHHAIYHLDGRCQSALSIAMFMNQQADGPLSFRGNRQVERKS